MPLPYPEEFRARVIDAARRRGADVTLGEVAAEHGVHPMTLRKWLRSDDGSYRRHELDTIAIRLRNRELEMENEVLRRAAASVLATPVRGKAGTRS